MPMTEERALELISALISKPEAKAEDVPRIFQELLAVYDQAFAAPVVPMKKRRRRGNRSSGNPGLQGWPSGVRRQEYQAWKEQQVAAGRTTGLNPQTYKAERDANQPTPTAPTKAEKARAGSQPKRAASSKSKK